jgi:hypothetical protein
MTQITTFQNRDLPLLLTFSSNGVALDITGWTIYFTLKKPDGTGNILEETATILDAPNGLAEIDLSRVDSNTLVGTFGYEISFLDSSNKARTPLQSIISFAESYKTIS